MMSAVRVSAKVVAACVLLLVLLASIFMICVFSARLGSCKCSDDASVSSQSRLHAKKEEALKDIEVDLVVTWVDGRDTARNELRAHYKQLELGQKASSAPSFSNARFVNNNELYFMVWSAKKFAPWLRTIWILASGNQRPDWLDSSDDRVKVVYDSDIFDLPDQHLPTFNSHALECHLHKIPGLSEYFIYANDDMFFGDYVPKSEFITPDGKVRSYYMPLLNTERGPHRDDDDHLNAWRNNNRLLDTVKVQNPRPYPMHTHSMLTKTMMAEAEATFSDAWKETCSHRFRRKSDIHPVGLAQFLGSYNDRSVWQASNVTRNLSLCFTDSAEVNEVLFGLVCLIKPAMFCINDNSKAPTDEVRERMLNFMLTYFGIDRKDIKLKDAE